MASYQMHKDCNKNQTTTTNCIIIWILAPSITLSSFENKCGLLKYCLLESQVNTKHWCSSHPSSYSIKTKERKASTKKKFNELSNFFHVSQDLVTINAQKIKKFFGNVRVEISTTTSYGRNRKTCEEPWNKMGSHHTQYLKIHQHVWICGNVQYEWQLIRWHISRIFWIYKVKNPKG